MTSTVSPNAGKRLLVLDQYRGLAIALMALTHFLSRVVWVPSWLKNTLSAGFHPPDLIAPMFVFAMGMSYPISLRRRLERDGATATYRHFVRRGLALIGFGVLVMPWEGDWGLFQTLGTVILLALPLIRLPAKWRALAGGMLLAGYQGLLHCYWTDVIYAGWGGMRATLGWTALLLLATALYDSRRLNQNLPWLLAVLSLVLGIIISFWLPPRMHRANMTYVLLGVGGSTLVYLGVARLSMWKANLLKPLQAWGRNPLLLYGVHYYLWVYAFLYPNADWWHRHAALWLIVVQGVAFFTVLHALATLMDRRRIYLSL